jgi:hypothetical protein
MRFRVIVHGRSDGAGIPPRGFLTARAVEAPSAISASEMARALVRNDPRVAGLSSNRRCPEFHLEIEIAELSQFDDCDQEAEGFIFYDEAVAPSRAS